MIEVLAQAEAAGSTAGDSVARFLTLFGAVVGILTAAVIYANSRRVKPYRPRTESNLANVVQIEAPEPQRWRDKKFPEDWESEDTRKAYWVGKRRSSQLVSGGAGIVLIACFNGYVFDLWDMAPLWLFYGILAVPYFAGGLRRTASLQGEPWKELTLRGKTAKLIMVGSKGSVLARCFAALHTIGGVVVRYDADEGLIVAATGREAWWYTPERVEVRVRDLGNQRSYVSLKSDDPAPAPAAVLKPNLANVRRLVAELSSSSPEPGSTVELHDTGTVKRAGAKS